MKTSKDKINARLAIRHFVAFPEDYVEKILKYTPTKQQLSFFKVLPKAINKKKNIAIRSGHGTGKTRTIAAIIKWFMDTRPFPRVIVTAPTQHQLYDIAWSELSKVHSGSVTRDSCEWKKTSFYNKKYPETWFAVARTSRDPEGMQGFHAEHLLFIVDEASGVSQEILEAIEGSQTQDNCTIVLLGNPTKISGGFYDAFHSKRNFYYTFRFNSEESEIVNPLYCEQLAAKYGKDSDIYRVRVLGEFPKAEPDTLISIDKCESAVIREDARLSSINDPIEIGCDVARYGGDETTIYSRQGFVSFEECIIRSSDLMTVCGELIKVMRKYPGRNYLLNIDDSGLGGGVTDRMIEVVNELHIPCIVTGVNNGSTARDSETYVNTGTEMWYYMKEWIQQAQIPNDQDLIGQLSSRKYGVNSKGKCILESKEQMKARGVTSPDRAEGLILTLRSLIYPICQTKSRNYAC